MKNRKYESDHLRRICPTLQISTEKDFGILIILGKCAKFFSVEKTELRMCFSFVYRTKSVSTHIQSSLHRQSIRFISFSCLSMKDVINQRSYRTTMSGWNSFSFIGPLTFFFSKMIKMDNQIWLTLFRRLYHMRSI